MSKTAMSLFTGFGLADVGMMNAGYELICGLEIDPRLAEVANYNLGGHVRVEDILDADPSMFPKPDLLHASPPCPNFSVAKAGAVETEYDIALAEKVAEFVRVLLPSAFTLENVSAYRKGESYRRILKALSDCGYMYDVQLLNSADFGVPQTRRRLWLRAVRGGLVPNLPMPTEWGGWYSAIEDLISTLPASKFADWQLRRLELVGTTLVDSAGFPGQDGITVPVKRNADEPANTIVANFERRPMRAFITDARNGRYGGQMTVVDEQRPMFGINATNNPNRYRAWLSQGRTVAMTPRALARFQSFPDWYVLPEKKSLACLGIGNGVPCLMMQRIAEGF